MTASAPRLATYRELCELPENVVGEPLFGVLHASPRPGPGHAAASSILGGDLGPPFHRGRGGPGGWVILDEPESYPRISVLTQGTLSPLGISRGSTLTAALTACRALCQAK